MSISISDSFDGIRQLTDYDEPGTAVPSTDVNLGKVLANVVQNLRAFSAEIDRDREQSDLDSHEQTDPLPLLPAGMEGDTNTDIELFPRVPGENWTTVGSPDAPDSTGLSAQITYGKMTAYHNWKAGVVTLSGGTAQVHAESVMQDFPINISGLDKISYIVDITGTGTVTAATLTLIDSSENTTAEVSLTNDTGKRWVANLSSFTGIDLTMVTRVIIHVTTNSSPTSGDHLYLFAVHHPGRSVGTSHLRPGRACLLYRRRSTRHRHHK